MEASRLLTICVAIAAGFACMFFCMFVSLFVAFDQSEKRRNEARDKRFAEHRMNARLLRLDI
jgi:choline-glycine betaine transporter